MKFRYKLMMGMLITLCFSFGIGGILLIYYSFQYSMDTITSNCMQNYNNVQNTIKIAGQTADGNYDDIFESVLSQMNDKKSTIWKYIKLVDVKTGELIYSNSSEDISKDVSTEVEDAIVTEYSWKDGETYYYQITGDISICLLDSDTVIKKLSICIVYDITQVYDFRNSELSIYRNIMIALLIFGIALAFLFSFWLTKSMEQLSKVVRKIAKGDIKSRAVISSGDEIEMLSNDINVMADTIESDMEKLKESVEKQEFFMAGFAHEMKTPMTSIIGYSDLIRSHNLDVEEMKESANYIFRESKRLEALSLKMLELVVMNKDEASLKVSNPADVINDVTRMIKVGIQKKNITLKVSLENGKVLLDRDLFQSMLNNLIDNAIKSIDGAGEIHVTGRKKDGEYIIQIRDNGRGMSEEELGKITEAFYRVDKSRSRLQGGAGLGLAICKKIAEIHHTELAYESQPGEGTKVTITMREYRKQGGRE